jgi:hypothetical protein
MSEPSSVSESVKNVCARCAHDALLDDPWQDLGFSRRPRRGFVFSRFLPAWKVDLEKRVLQELLIAFTAAHAVAGWITADEMPRVVSVYTSTADLLRALGYSSREQAADHLTHSIAAYSQERPNRWGTLLCSRLSPLAIPDKHLSGRICVGCVRFGLNLESMVAGLQSALKAGGKAR